METLLEANRDSGPIFTLVQKVRIFAPENMETGDILLAGNIIIAKAVIYFMAADWVTGEVTDVNGGYYID